MTGAAPDAPAGGMAYIGALPATASRYSSLA
jgi:hypothetical protein